MKRSRFFSRRQWRSRSAFTLVEMLVTLAVFILLTACVFGIVSSVLQSASTLRDIQQRRDQSAALELFLRTKLQRMTGSSLFISYQAHDGSGGSPSGIVFDFAGHAEAFGTVAQPNGLFTLRYVDRPTSERIDGLTPAGAMLNDLTKDDPQIAWQPLVRDIQRIDWKFQDANGGPWVDAWDVVGMRPALVRLSLQLAGESRPSVSIFWIPPLVNAMPAWGRD